MKKLLAVLSVACCATIAWAAENTDSLKEGEPVAAFYVTDVTGPSAGEKLCYRCKYGSRPVVSIFAKQMNEKVAAAQQIKNTPLTTFDGLAGPSEYKISKDADITVMMWVDSKVKVNEALKAKDLTDAKISSLTEKTKLILN